MNEDFTCILCNHQHGVNQYCLTLVQREVPAAGTTQALTFTRTMICGCPSGLASSPTDEETPIQPPEVNLNLTTQADPVSDSIAPTPPEQTQTVWGIPGN